MVDFGRNGQKLFVSSSMKVRQMYVKSHRICVTKWVENNVLDQFQIKQSEIVENGKKLVKISLKMVDFIQFYPNWSCLVGKGQKSIKISSKMVTLSKMVRS
jgi:hypothetical protein